MLEQYNGLGYAARGLPSPYLWAGTDQYRAGKYVRDGVYDFHAVDSQAGCAGLLLALRALDPTVGFAGVPVAPAPAPAAVAPAPPTITRPPSIANPSSGSIGAFIAPFSPPSSTEGNSHVVIV